MFVINMPACARVLVAEDNPMDALLLKRAMARSKINIPMEFVRDGQEAIDFLSTGSTAEKPPGHDDFPGLLLLDLKMPRLNGFDVLRWVRAQKGLNRIVVVVLTSSGEAQDINQAYDLGANSYVMKPSDFGQLQRFVETIQSYWIEMNQFAECRAA
jgi:CheY-like chemotaxis protein